MKLKEELLELIKNNPMITSNQINTRLSHRSRKGIYIGINLLLDEKLIKRGRSVKDVRMYVYKAV